MSAVCALWEYVGVMCVGARVRRRNTFQAKGGGGSVKRCHVLPVAAISGPARDPIFQTRPGHPVCAPVMATP